MKNNQAGYVNKSIVLFFSLCSVSQLIGAIVFIPTIAGQINSEDDFSYLITLGNETKTGGSVTTVASGNLPPITELKPEISPEEVRARQQAAAAKEREANAARERRRQARIEREKLELYLQSVKSDPERKEKENVLAVVVKKEQEAVADEAFKVEEAKKA